MVTLLNMPAITKTELINKMVYDKTTGIELINRLIKQGLITEAENPADKRSKLIHVTESGRGVLFSSFEELNKVSQIIPGRLNADELMTLIHLLDKLDNHHLNIWDEHKDSDLDTILGAHKQAK
jgi:DNA-binding MarR family transcriptional regulator